MQNYNHVKIVFVWVLYCCSTLLYSQESSPINLYYPNDYGGESQNWAISQSNEKNIYVANNRGILEFNGARWNFYKSPNETITRSVRVIDSLIYTGNYREFGYWKKNNYGTIRFRFGIININSIKRLKQNNIFRRKYVPKFLVFQKFNV